MFCKSSRRIFLLSSTVAVAFGVTIHAAQADIPDQDYQAVLDHMLNTVVPPKLDDFHAATEKLTAEFNDFCSDPDKAGLEDTQMAFHAAFSLFIQALRFYIHKFKAWYYFPMR